MPNHAGQLPRLSDISSQYQGILSDVWGVVHNGISAHPEAVDALVEYRNSGGHVVLITNAARTTPPVRQLLDDMNVPREAYDAIITSGDVTRDHVAKYKGQVIHYVGPATDHPLFDGLGVIEGSAEDARAVVVTGMDDPAQTPDDYVERINLWLERGLPMICANPDKVVEIGDTIVYCAGSLADIYAQRGGKVMLAGKPYEPIYQAANKALEEAVGHKVPASKILAIGDSVRTDATGAAIYGMDLLFITGSIHAEEIDAFGDTDPAAVRNLVAPSGANLVGYQTRLK